MSEEEVTDKCNAVDSMEYEEYIGLEQLYLDDENDGNDDEELPREPSSSIVTKRSLVETQQSRKRTKGKENPPNEDEKFYRSERLRKMIKQEEELFQLKCQHEEEIHNITIEHLKQKYKLEIRAATAAAELSKLNLLRQQNKN
ncbi:hypothetical protein G9C98_006998 [Cotesia typhae]|uniref:Uncharacterized protein n=1 Tax=Cotesia typhae TaxID=2053667 RepID=A0A8J5RKH0_9HYME|nr:hypothetical protein G9C98_006998 [Cotesia typhae]